MKEKIIIIATICLIIGFFVGQWYSENKQEIQDDDYIFSMKEKCKKVGEEVDRERMKDPFYSITSVEPEYAYNKKINTCLYYAEFKFGSNPPYGSYIGVVKDALSNKVIMQFHARIDKDDTLLSCDGCIDKEDFYSKKVILFNQ